MTTTRTLLHSSNSKDSCSLPVEESPPPTVSAFGYRLDGVQDMLLRQPSDDDSSDSESEPEEDDERWVLLRDWITSSLPHDLNTIQTEYSTCTINITSSLPHYLNKV